MKSETSKLIFVCILALSSCVAGASYAVNVKPASAKPAVSTATVREWPSDRVGDCLEQKAAENKTNEQNWERFKQYKSDAEVAELRGEYSKAREAWKQAAFALQKTDLFEWCISSLANLYIKHGNYDEGISAINSLTQNSKKTPVGATCALTIGRILESKKDYSGVVSAYLEAVNRSPGSDAAVSAVAALKNVYLTIDKPYPAIGKLSEIANLYTAFEAGAQASCCIGDVYIGFGKEDEGIQKLVSVAKKSPHSHGGKEAKNTLGTLYTQKALQRKKANDVEGALSAFRLAFEYSGSPDTLLMLINSLLNANKANEAYSYANKGLTSDDYAIKRHEYMLTYYNAVACHMSGDTVTATKLMNNLISRTNSKGQVKVLQEIVTGWANE